MTLSSTVHSNCGLIFIVSSTTTHKRIYIDSYIIKYYTCTLNLRYNNNLNGFKKQLPLV